MKKLFSLLVLLTLTLTAYHAQAQSCRLDKDSLTAGNRTSTYNDYIYAGSLLGQVSRVDSGQLSASESHILIYSGTDVSQIKTITHWGGDTVRQILTYTYTGGKISRIYVEGDTTSANPWSIAHDVTYDGNGNIQNIVLDQSAITGNPKGLPASFTNITWANGNITSLNLVIGSDTVELTVAQVDDKNNFYRHLVNTDGAPYLFQSATTNNLLRVELVNNEVIDGNPIPSGTPVINETLSYNSNNEVITRVQNQSLFSDNPSTIQYIYTCTSGIFSPAAATSISIYPNPASEFIRLENASFSGVVKIYDIAGKVVLNQNITTSASTLDVRSLKAGVYYVEMTDNNKVFKAKFLKN